MNENKTVTYFAYGSNMDVEQMRMRCPGAEILCTAVLPDYKFALDSEGYATVVPYEGKEVRGVIWKISRANEKALDWYEGVSKGCYGKEELKARPDGYSAKVPVLVYVSRRGKNNGERKDGYIGKIVAAATKLGFDDSYRGMLKDIWVGYANEDVRGQRRASARID